MQPTIFSRGLLGHTLPPCLLVILTALATSAASADIPRTTSGKPDLSGYYDGGTRTPVERPPALGERAFMTAEEAARIGTGTEFLDDGRSNDPNRPPPPKGGDGVHALGAGNVGGYNAFWVDPGSGVVPIDGKYPTSVIYDPPNGREPRMTMKGYAKKADNFSSFTYHNDGTASWLDKPGPGPFDGPEELALAERCLLGFSAGPPLLPGLYNNHKRIVQTEDHVMILAEMVHDARIVRLNDEHAPDDLRRWLGDAIGHWEGDTLVVETANFREDTGLYGAMRTSISWNDSRWSRTATSFTSSRSTTRPPGRRRGAADTSGRRAHSPSTSTPATKATIRCSTYSGVPAAWNARSSHGALRRGPTDRSLAAGQLLCGFGHARTETAHPTRTLRAFDQEIRSPARAGTDTACACCKGGRDQQ